MLLKAYLDESRHSDGPKCVVAGWVGTLEQWAACEKEWLTKLKPRSSLHMNDLRWNSKRDRLKRLLEKMGPIPARHGLQRVAGGMKHQDYQEVVAGTIAERALSPYMGCVQLCLHAMLDTMSPRQHLHVYFEEQKEHAHHVGILHEAVFKERQMDHRLLGMTFLGKHESWCFQPADYLAFHLSTKAIDEECDKAVLTRPINGPGMGWNYDRAKLKRDVDYLTKQLGGASLPRFGASRKRKK